MSGTIRQGSDLPGMATMMAARNNRAAMIKWLRTNMNRYEIEVRFVDHPSRICVQGRNYWAVIYPSRPGGRWPPKQVIDEWHALMAQAFRIRQAVDDDPWWHGMHPHSWMTFPQNLKR